MESSALSHTEESPSLTGSTWAEERKAGKRTIREKCAKMGFPILFQLIGRGLQQSAVCPQMEDTGQKLSSD